MPAQLLINLELQVSDGVCTRCIIRNYSNCKWSILNSHYWTSCNRWVRKPPSTSFSNNLKLFSSINYKILGYRNIPSILMSSKYLLLPYSNKVSVNSKNLEISNYMSPLKMFDTNFIFI